MSIDEDSIVHLVRGNSSDNCRVVKRSANSLVVEDTNYFYKIKANGTDAKECFEEIVLRAFSQVYQELGLDWEVSAVSDGSQDFLVERRQKLKVASAGDFTFEEVLANAAEVKRRVENRLEFPRLLAQLRLSGNFEHIQKIVLARDSEEDYSDYAFYVDNIVPLGNSNYFIALIDALGSWDSGCNAVAVPVNLGYGDFFFTEDRVFDNTEKAAVRLFEVSPKWWLFPQQGGNIVEVRKQVASQLQQMFENNLKIFYSKKQTDVLIDNDLLNFKEECYRLSLNSGDHE